MNERNTLGQSTRDNTILWIYNISNMGHEIHTIFDSNYIPPILSTLQSKSIGGFKNGR